MDKKVDMEKRISDATESIRKYISRGYLEPDYFGIYNAIFEKQNQINKVQSELSVEQIREMLPESQRTIGENGLLYAIGKLIDLNIVEITENGNFKYVPAQGKANIASLIGYANHQEARQ